VIFGRPPMVNADGSSGGCEGSGGVDGGLSAEKGEGENKLRPPICEGVGVTVEGWKYEASLGVEVARVAPRTEGHGSVRWCDGG